MGQSGVFPKQATQFDRALKLNWSPVNDVKQYCKSLITFRNRNENGGKNEEIRS